MMGWAFVSLLDQSTNFFLGMSTFVAAAFVFQRSRKAALFVALAGLSFALAQPIELVFTQGTIGSMRQALTLLVEVVGVASHVIYFGGLALALRTIAVESPA